MKRLASLAALSFSLALLVGSLACSSDDPTNYPQPKYDTGGTQKDGPVLYLDKGVVKNDMYVFPDQQSQVKDGGGTASDSTKPTTDSGGSTSPDSGSTPNCPGPTGAKCSPSCPSAQMCVAAKGGLCANTVKLSGPASAKGALLAVARAYIKCWKPAPSVDKLCATFDACSMTGQITEQMVEDWVCKQAQTSDFSGAQEYKDAKDILCGFTGDRVDWKMTGTIQGGKKGLVCLSYDSISWWPDSLYVNLCTVFPPT